MECRNCRKEFTPKKRGRKNTGFCCKKCADNWRQRNVYDLLPKKYKKVCDCCGKEFETNRGNQKYCSVSCASHHRRSDFQSNKECRVCGKPFVAHMPNEVFCSSECRHLARRKYEEEKRRRRRSMTKDYHDNKIDAGIVFQEANGICAICGKPVPRDCDANDIWSGTRDHIIPVSLYGKHSYSNCQLAHRMCNSIKRQNGPDFRIDWLDRAERDSEKWEPRLSHLDGLISSDQRIGT